MWTWQQKPPNIPQQMQIVALKKAIWHSCGKLPHMCLEKLFDFLFCFLLVSQATVFLFSFFFHPHERGKKKQKKINSSANECEQKFWNNRFHVSATTKERPRRPSGNVPHYIRYFQAVVTEDIHVFLSWNKRRFFSPFVDLFCFCSSENPLTAIEAQTSECTNYKRHRCWEWKQAMGLRPPANLLLLFSQPFSFMGEKKQFPPFFSSKRQQQKTSTNQSK